MTPLCAPWPPRWRRCSSSLAAATRNPSPSPPASATITPSGGDVGVAGATLSIPAGALTDEKPITLQRVAAQLPEIADSPADYRAAIAKQLHVSAVFEAGPDALELAKPGVLTVTIAPGDLPKGKTLADVRAVAVSKDGSVEDLTILGTNGNDIRVAVKHFSFLVFAVALGAIAFTGALALMMRGVSEPLLRRDCAKWLEPDHAEVARLAADPNRFSIDTKTGAVKLDIGKPLRGMDVDQGAHTLRVGAIIERGMGDCVNMTTLFGSLLVAKGNPVRMVAGTATYERGNKTYQGFHQWAETVIDGKAYYVDTFDPAGTKLIPIDQATAELALERNRMCGKNADGVTQGPAKYSAWYADLLADDSDLREQLERLKTRHRELHVQCTGGDDAACAERTRVYDQATAIQEKLNE